MLAWLGGCRQHDRGHVCLHTRLSGSLPTTKQQRLSVCPVGHFVCLSACLSVCLHVCLSGLLFVLQDLVIPSPKFSPHYRWSPLLGAPPQTRDTLLYFRGDVGGKRKPNYSRGIRQQLHALAQTPEWRKQGVKVGTREEVAGDYSRGLASSKFCLVAPGNYLLPCERLRACGDRLRGCGDGAHFAAPTAAPCVASARQLCRQVAPGVRLQPTRLFVCVPASACRFCGC